MRIHTGFEIAFDCASPTLMLLCLSVHPSRRDELETPDVLLTSPYVPVRQYIDGFGNICSRVVAPAGRFVLSADFIIRDSGLVDDYAPGAVQGPTEDLPDAALVFLLGSRYCETDQLSNIAWSLFGGTQPGWARVQAITDFVHNHIVFDYEHARPTRSAYQAYVERQGVCRDYAHLAVAFCRCMNIPARYCTGYLGDIGVPVVGEMDFSAWFEVFLGDRWYTFDARNNQPRIGRVLIARGRDATDVAISNAFGEATLAGFKVISVEASAPAGLALSR
ncbi:transglutaminase family protein [Phenylobacterium sp.]|uniref:transglutaminase-like domain-containing protein n=1 Tax=Phenylobacterium sp. TaxID=1871053 RepID=UPI00273695E5|nr:transglutaminase family protein [Phenylobacterium sp.]MDP3660566.1 transglutaminase family protein [Phenylobacterium sp.]